MSSDLRRSSQLNATVLKVFLEGGYTMLFLFTLHKFYSAPKDMWRRRGFRQTIMLALIVLLYVCIMITMGTDWDTLDYAFVKNGSTSDSVVNALNDAPLVANLLPNAAKVLALFVADSILIWRCWVVWNRSWLIITPLVLLNLGFLATSILNLITIAVPTVSFAQQPAVTNIVTALFSLTLATTILGTSLIIFRILQVGRVDLDRYRNALEIIIESSALYSLSIIFVLPYWVNHTDPVKGYPLKFAQAINGTMAGIAPTLLFVRVISGAARPDDSWLPHLTTIPESSISKTRYSLPKIDVDIESAESSPSGQITGLATGSWHYQKRNIIEDRALSSETVAVAA